MQAGTELPRVDRGSSLELVVSGRMDGYWSRHVEEAIDELMREGSHRIRVNLSKTSHISSAVIRGLVHAFKQFSAVGGALLVVEPSPAVRKILDLSRLGEMLCAPPRPRGGCGRTKASDSPRISRVQL